MRKTGEARVERGIEIHCGVLGGVDPTRSTGRMTMSVINAVAEFERDLLIERLHAGLIRAEGQGKVLGRHVSLTAAQKQVIRETLEEGLRSRSAHATMAQQADDSAGTR